MHEEYGAVVDRCGTMKSYEETGYRTMLADKVINHYDVLLNYDEL